MRKVCVVVNSRANYGRIKSFMLAALEEPGLQLQVVVGASALLYRFGNVRDIITADGFHIEAEVYSVVEGNEPIAMASSAGLAVTQVSAVLHSLKPDVVVVIADRYEQIATALAASFLNIPVAHVQGGEVTGSIDESVRHAITKMAHIHFPATELSARRILQMGENPTSVHVVGCPSLDLISNAPRQVDERVWSAGVGSRIDQTKPYLVVLQHPVTTEQDAYAQVSQTLEAVGAINLETNIQVAWLWPNVDSGSDSVSKRLREFREAEQRDNFHFFRNFSPENYIALIRQAKCIVGNSSSGIREASALGTPSVNVGSRQNGRESGPNVLHVGYESREIAKAIRQQLDNGRYTESSLYGSGNAGKKIAETLATVPLDVNKFFCDSSS